MSFRMPDHIVETLLDKLGSDDAFREAFSTNPREALAGLGFSEAADTSVSRGIWMCMTVNELASKEAIRSAASEFRAQFRINAGVFTPFVLEARGVELAA
jgi:putative modified peptide